MAAPLLVYSLTLATFGAAHVLSELRYVDRRFGHRLGIPRVVFMGLMLAGAVAARSCGVFGFMDAVDAVVIELSFVVALALSAAVGEWPRRILATGIAATIGIATLAAPFDTAISLSILHNLTPLAFLYDIVPPRSRRGWMALALAAFIGLPLLVATGLPRELLAAAGAAVPALDPLGAGPLALHLRIYVPTPLIAGASAVDLFSASVVAQCAHYAAVIVVLPMLLAAREPGARGLIAWPRGGAFAAIVAAISAFVLLRFAGGFVPTRALYGIAASVHAWVEVPLVVIALTGTRQPSASPAAKEVALASIETASARGGESAAPHATIAASTTTTAPSVTAIVGQ